MKRIVAIFMVMVLCLMGWTTNVEGSLLSNEEMYGKKMYGFQWGDYAGDIVLGDLYAYRDGDEYVFTLLYSGGQLESFTKDGHTAVKTSFFSPPDGDLIQLSWIKNFDKVSSDEQTITYRTSVEVMEQLDIITVFLYDANLSSDEQDINYQIEFDTQSFDNIPTIDEVVTGYDPSSVKYQIAFDLGPSSWADAPILELLATDILRDEAFNKWQDGITRLDFVYLMVTLYETITGQPIVVDDGISFDDCEDVYALKAASVEITSGIGGGLFGPDILLTREQMTTFMVRTLKASEIDLTPVDNGYKFSDDDGMSYWAKDSIYLAKRNSIMGGVGDNNFSPKGTASREQALVIMNRLLAKYTSYKWYQALESDRVYIRFGNDLYAYTFSDQVMYDKANVGNSVFFTELEDVQALMSIANLSENALAYDPIVNPNVKGSLKLPTTTYMSMDSAKLFSGVDTVGEKTDIKMTSKYNMVGVSASIETNTKTNKIKHTGFESVNYYSLDGQQANIVTLPIKEILAELGIEMTVKWNKLWEILEIEFVKIEK